MKKGDGFVFIVNLKVKIFVCVYKMSKFRGNVVNSDDVVGEYGVDFFCLYEMFMGLL